MMRIGAASKGFEEQDMVEMASVEQGSFAACYPGHEGNLGAWDILRAGLSSGRRVL